MFDFSEKPVVWIPVRWPSLVQRSPDALAEPVEIEIHCLVELVDETRLEEISKKFAPEQLTEDELLALTPEAIEVIKAKAHANEIAAFKELVQDWRGVKDKGEPVPMTDEWIAKLIRRPLFSQSFNRCFQEAMMGRMETREGNSEGSPANGLVAEPEVATK